jgi:undecaprenyl-diphosphatase
LHFSNNFTPMLQRLHNSIIYYDHICWYYLNNQWHTAAMDAVIPFFRNQWTWLPVYLFLALYMPKAFGRRGYIWCLYFMICFAVSDQISATLMKPFFHRVRPCNNPELAALVHNIVPCGGGGSFPSSHASNHFAIGVFIALTLGKQFPWLRPVPLFWALLVAYAQVYVGVHYPLDVFCGALLGSTIGIGAAHWYNKNYDLAEHAPR